MKLVQARLNARGDEESIFSLVWRCSEARAGLFKCQERRRKQFSPVCRSCEARASMFKCQGRRGKHIFTTVEVCRGSCKLILVPGKIEKAVLITEYRCCEARAGLFKYLQG